MSNSDAPQPRPPAQPLDGWEERFVGTEPKLSEVAQLYRELGFEVRIEPYRPEACEGCCSVCFDESPLPNMVVYVRKGDAAVADDLF